MAWTDMAPLVEELRAYLRQWEERLRCSHEEVARSVAGRGGEEQGRGQERGEGRRRERGEGVQHPMNSSPDASGRRRSVLVLSGDVAVELGHPSTVSQNVVLLTSAPGQVRHGTVWTLGPELGEMSRGERRPFAQVVLLQLRQGATIDPFRLETAQYLTNRLEGYMVRSLPGRLWVRISQKARAAGLNLSTVGRELIRAYLEQFEAVEGVEVLLVTSSADEVKALAPLVTEAQILTGQHKRLTLDAEGELECVLDDCDSCNEKPVCDNLRDILRERRTKRRRR